MRFRLIFLVVLCCLFGKSYIYSFNNIVRILPKQGYSVTMRFKAPPIVNVLEDSVTICENANQNSLCFKFQNVESISYPKDYAPDMESGMVQLGPIYIDITPTSILIDRASFDSSLDIISLDDKNLMHLNFDIQCGFNRREIPAEGCTIQIDDNSFKCNVTEFLPD